MFGCEKEGFRSVVLHKYKEYRIYIDLLIAELQSRFEPWPEWIVLSERALNFTNDSEYLDRQASFEQLLNESHGVTPLLDDEKDRLKAEYVTLHLNAMMVSKKLNEEGYIELKAERIWYLLLTDEKYYHSCKFLNDFCLRFLIRSINECIDEAEV